MFFSTTIGDQTKFTIVRNDQWNNQKLIVALFDLSTCDRKGYGLRPKTSEAKNSFDDKDCDHLNFVGDIVTLDQGSIRTKAIQSLGFPELLEIRTYNLSLPWREITTPVFLGSPCLEFTSDWRAYETMEYCQKHMTDCSGGDEVLIEVRLLARRKSSPAKYWTYQIIRQTHEIDFELNRKRVGSTVTYGSESNPNPIPMDWALIIPGDWTDLSYERVQSTQVPAQLDFDLKFWERIFEEPAYESGIPNDLLSFGDLAQNAIDSTRALDINTPAFLLDFLKTKDILLGIWKVLSGDLSPKALSSLFLSFRYGVNLTVKDAKELASAIKQMQRDIPDEEYSIVRRGISGEGEAYYTEVGLLKGDWSHNFKMYYDPYPDNFRKLVRQAYSWDLYPSWQNLWDYIPFSFVLDWFLQVEDELERWDTRNYVATLRFESCILTSKKTYPLPDSLLSSVGGTSLINNVNVVIFKRRVVATPPMPISRLDSPSGPFTNWLEGSALFIQRMF